MRSTIELGKKITRKIGIFHFTRNIYRRFSPLIRERVVNDVALYSPIIKRGDLIFDIGANLGQKTEIFRSLGARVVSVEANPLCVAQLRKKFAGASDITIMHAAVSAEPGSMTLYFSGTDATASLDPQWFAQARKTDTQTVAVPVTTLAALMAEHGAPDYIKIDVEGHEPKVFVGMPMLPPLLSFEYHTHQMAALRACLARLAALGDFEVNAIELHGGAFRFDAWWAGAAVTPEVIERDFPASGDLFVRPGR